MRNRNWTQLEERLKVLGRHLLSLDEQKPWVKYAFVTGILFFYVLFFSERNLLNYLDLRDQYHDLQEQYKIEQESYRQDSLRIIHSQGGPAEIEKLARERYYMKEEGEDIYLIKPDSSMLKQ